MDTINRFCKNNFLKSLIILSIIWLLTFHNLAYGKSVSSMYTIKELEHLRNRYEENIYWNYNHVIKPQLTYESKALHDIKLEFPLIGKRGEPFEFYSEQEIRGRRIVMPIFSIKFLDDLSIALSWIVKHGYTEATIKNYIAMLKYRESTDFTNNRYPDPLIALHIPRNALEDPTVDRLAQNILKGTITYLLCRELGYILVTGSNYREPSFYEQKERGETRVKADTFALEILRRLGVPPFFLAFFFTSKAFWIPYQSDFNNDSSYFRYLRERPEVESFPARLSNISGLMIRGKKDYSRFQKDKDTTQALIELSARQISGLNEIFHSVELQKYIKNLGLKLKVEDLQPWK